MKPKVKHPPRSATRIARHFKNNTMLDSIRYILYGCMYFAFGGMMLFSAGLIEPINTKKQALIALVKIFFWPALIIGSWVYFGAKWWAKLPDDNNPPQGDAGAE